MERKKEKIDDNDNKLAFEEIDSNYNLEMTNLF
jgi:hypothetical protein